MKSSLASVNGVIHHFEIKISGFGAFPNKNRPRVLWLGLIADQMGYLHDLHQWVENEMEKIGFEKEHRRFSPHLTVARVKFPADFTDLFNFTEKHPFTESSISVDEIILMRSELKQSGAVYSQIQRYVL